MADFQQPPTGPSFPGCPGAKHGGGVYGKGYGESAPPPQRERDPGYGSYADYDPTYFPPPPKPDARYGYPDEHSYHQHDNSSRASQQPSWQGSQQRGRVPSDVYANDGAALEPYDEEKAYAQYTAAYGPPDYSQYGQQQYSPAQPRAPPSTASIGRYGKGQDDKRRRSYQDDQSPRYDGRDTGGPRGRDTRSVSRAPTSATADYERRRREHRRRARDDNYYDYRPRERKPTSPTNRNGERGGKDILRGGDGERGIGATLLGGAAGAFLGDQADRGPLGTLGGAVLGAVAAGGIDRMKSKKDQEKQLKDRKRYGREPMTNGAQDPYYSARGSTVSPSAPRDEFRPRRHLRGQLDGGRRGRREDSLSDSYTSGS
ncbi:hypothetical protein EJ03DRAFT_215606 [Teratosphaeria nubilosa]|uniref:Glycine zipper 2TM domain-containing protein n=1 Tax=Teratosphaeria nubilosa TaxID=161662 RepID=A0A6G1LI24_9PEZI|nr:hypothetical protein EJ03DRAFT_215606 [Teratosphaeria nubilosa]